MTTQQEPSAASVTARLDELRSDAELTKYERYFPLAKRGDDVFIGVRMGEVFAVAKQSQGMPLAEIEVLLDSPFHEVRVAAVSIMDFEARRAQVAPERKRELFELYLRRHDRINSWDLVDRSAIHVVGRHLADRPRDLLDTLAASTDVWERRTAIVSTLYFTGHGDTVDAIRIATTLLTDPEDTIHKAVGWALRTLPEAELLPFLNDHAARMPRIALRAAIEKLTPEQRKHYLALKP